MVVYNLLVLFALKLHYFLIFNLYFYHIRYFFAPFDISMHFLMLWDSKNNIYFNIRYFYLNRQLMFYKKVPKVATIFVPYKCDILGWQKSKKIFVFFFTIRYFYLPFIKKYQKNITFTRIENSISIFAPSKCDIVGWKKSNKFLLLF